MLCSSTQLLYFWKQIHANRSGCRQFCGWELTCLPSKLFAKISGLSILVGGWPTPLKNMNVNWDDYSQYMEKYKSCSNHHQPEYQILPFSYQSYPGRLRPNKVSSLHFKPVGTVSVRNFIYIGEGFRGWSVKHPHDICVGHVASFGTDQELHDVIKSRKKQQLPLTRCIFNSIIRVYSTYFSHLSKILNHIESQVWAPSPN